MTSLSFRQRHIGFAIGTVLILLAGGLVLFNGSTAQASKAQVALGKQVYVENCAGCHGPNGEGEVPDAPLKPNADGLFPAPPHDSTGHTWHHSDALIREIIEEGRVDDGFKPMPAFGDVLTQEQIDAVMVYIKTWWTPEQIEIQATVSAQESQP